MSVYTWMCFPIEKRSKKKFHKIIKHLQKKHEILYGTKTETTLILKMEELPLGKSTAVN